jgi:serine/threonine-protein kinase
MRVANGATGVVNCPGLCACTTPSPKKVPTFAKGNQADLISFDPSSVGLSQESYPVERYAPIAFLGDTARATTILCRDRQRGSKVAVKCFKRILPAQRSIFESEVHKNKELNHTSIAKIVDYGFHNNKAPYVVSEYKDGFNIEQCLAIYGTPSHDVAIKILIGVCESLVYALKQGVMHRDIRPGNIIFLDDMNSEPSVAVLDFAMPKIKAAEPLTDVRDTQYITGDEARNLEYDERSEVYGVGSVGYTLLTARPPFTKGSALEIKNDHALVLAPRITDVKFDNTRPKELEEIVERCMEKDPRYRFLTVQDLKDRLEVFPNRARMRIAKLLSARQQKKIAMIAGGVIAAIALCAGALALLGHH